MPKKASMTPAKQQAKKTPIAIAETDTKWEKLAKPGTAVDTKTTPKKQTTPIPGTTTSNSTPKRQTKSTPTTSKSYSLEYSTDETKFPHGRFNVRLDYMEGTDKRICWFESKDHFIKHITRYKITKYEATTNDMALVGETTRRKGTQKR